MQQEILSFEKIEKLDWNNFVEGPENRDAITYLVKWPDWSNNGLIIHGNSGVGKTHLVTLWAQTANAVFISEKDMPSDPRSLFSDDANFVFDNFDNFLEAENFDWLFHFINIAREKQKFFVFVSRHQPSFWTITLNDLRSRILALPSVHIENPGDELLFKIAQKLCSDLGILIHENTINFILKRIDRQVNSVAKLLEILNKLSLQDQKKITIQFIQNHLDL